MWRNIRVIMFDWGGTLVRVARQENTWSPCAQAAAAFARNAGVVVSDEDAAALYDLFLARAACQESDTCFRELDTRAMLMDWAIDRGLDDRLQNPAAEMAEAFWRPWVGCLDMIDGAVDTMRQLAAAGFVMGLVSNCAASPTMCRREAARLGIAPMLSFMVFSSELGVRKPHADMYAQALALAAAVVPDLDAGEVLFVGDTPEADVDGPARHGMRTALVRTGRWGGDTASLRHQPDAILQCVNDLPGIFASERASSGQDGQSPRTIKSLEDQRGNNAGIL